MSDLAESFGVSEMTVRRDLQRAGARRQARARPRRRRATPAREPGFSQIEVERFDVKDRLGAAAAALVEDGQTVMIDIGTSTLQMARHLHGSKITVVTTNLAVVEELLPDPDIELVLPGGIVRRNYRSLVGVLAEDSLRQLKSDIAFLGTSGVDVELGVWDTTMVEVPIKRLMIAGADRVVLIADAAKFSMTGIVRVCGPESIDHVVTDAPLPAAVPLGRRRRRDRGDGRMKLTIVGGGGFRVPLVYGALLEKAERLGLDEVVLHDIDADAAGAHRRACSTGWRPSTATRLPFRTTTDLVDAVEGADFVFCAIRVGQLEGRVIDEDVPLGLGVLGQETTGPGGICFALRTIPVMVRLAETIAEHAPGRLADQLHQPGGDGHRGRPAGARRPRGRHLRLAVRAVPARRRGASGATPSELWFDYFGLNHLGWLQGRARRRRRRSCSTDLLEDDARLASFEEGRLFGGEWLRSLGMIPNEYLYYFYYAVGHGQRDPRAATPRGAFLLEQQREFYAPQRRTRRRPRWPTGAPPATTASAPTWPRRATPPATHHEHEHDANGGYESEAMAVLEAIALNTREVLILNTANRSSLPFLDERAVVEVPCVVGRAGPVPMAIGEVPAHARSLVEMMKDVERTTIDAALLGSRELAIRALALHPLVPSVIDGARDLRRLPQAAARAAGGVRVMASTSPAPSRPSST